MKPHGGQPVVTVGTPLGESHAAMIMVHGRNAAPKNILDLVALLNQPSFTYLAPAAADNSWYPYSFMAETEQNEPGITSGLQVLDALVRDLVTRGIRKQRVVLLGFSQGACLAAEFAVRHADRYGGVIVYSGGLIGPPGTAWKYDGSFGGTPVFFGCSDVDSHVPLDRVEESAAVAARMGGAITKRIYPGMGHLVNEDEIQFARELMGRVLADPR
jgi:predicted esterase